MGLRDRWAEGKPEFLILAGAVVGFAGTAAYLLWTILREPPAFWVTPAGTSAVGLALCVAIPALLARRRPRTARGFALLALLASLLVLLNYPGVVGGGITLVGAAWGILATHGSSP